MKRQVAEMGVSTVVVVLSGPGAGCGCTVGKADEMISDDVDDVSYNAGWVPFI